MRLLTPRLILREPEEADHVATNLYERDAHVVRYQSTDVQTLEGSLAYIRAVRAESAREPRRLYDLVVTRRDDVQALGRCGLRITRPEHAEAELWYVLRRDLWSRGYATEAATALLEHAFGALGLHRVYVDCDPRNARSIRVAEKLGMRHEGRLRESWFLKGEWCDSAVLAVLEREWRARADR